MKVYLASWFASKDEMRNKAEELRILGIEVTSRWLEEKVAGTTQIKDVEESYLRDTAIVDIEDILQANAVVLRVPSEDDLNTLDIPIASWARGGRHFEAGFQYATMVLYSFLPSWIKARGERALILWGRRENVFHYLDGWIDMKSDGIHLPQILVYETWEEVKLKLTLLAAKENRTMVS